MDDDGCHWDETDCEDLARKEREEFYSEMDELKRLYGGKFGMPERPAREEDEHGVCVLDAMLEEALAEIAEHNLWMVERSREQVERGEEQPRDARKYLEASTKDIVKIHEDMVAYRNGCRDKYLEITSRERAGEMSELQAEWAREDLFHERRKKITRLGLLSVGMDWPDIGEMTDDFYHIVPDGISPDFREKRKDLRERFAELSAEGKKKVLRRIGEEAEESEDHTVEEFFRQHIRGYSQSEY